MFPSSSIKAPDLGLLPDSPFLFHAVFNSSVRSLDFYIQSNPRIGPIFTTLLLPLRASCYHLFLTWIVEGKPKLVSLLPHWLSSNLLSTPRLDSLH